MTPAARLVNHLVDDERLVVRTSVGSELAAVVAEGAVAAFEADDIDCARQIGWSVVVTGPTRSIDA